VSVRYYGSTAQSEVTGSQSARYSASYIIGLWVSRSVGSRLRWLANQLLCDMQLASSISSPKAAGLGTRDGAVLRRSCIWEC